jgi:16S rRNA (adenine1518-N6/adenine1519-N6)-dimethyltransferase
MIQSEVADRLCALPGTPNYGSVTAYLNYFGTCKKLLKVPAGKFLPPPKVDSAVVRIDLYRDRPCKPEDENIFFRTMRAAFEQRRKTLPNALSAGFGELSKTEITDAITACGFDPSVRGERLSVSDFCILSNRLYQLIRSK